MILWTKHKLQQVLLQYAYDNDIFEVTDSLDIIMQKSRNELLQLHNHSIYQRNGYWVTKLGYHKPYKRISRINRTDLENVIIQFILDNNKSQITFAECFDKWMQTEQSADNPAICAKTITNYRATYRRFLADKFFCSKALLDITEADLRHLFIDIVDNAPIERKRLSEIKSLISGVYHFARMRLDLDVLHVKPILNDLSFNANQLKEPMCKFKQQIFLQDDLLKLSDYLKNENTTISLGILLVAQTGLRISEIAALTWDNVHNDYLFICQAEHSSSVNHKRTVTVGSPKSHKNRIVYLSDEAKNTIHRLRLIHPTQTGYVCLSIQGVRATCRIFDSSIRKYCSACNIPVLSLHKLRKTYATSMLASGIPIKSLQDQLGHNDFSTTANHYLYNPYNQDEQASIFRGVSVLLPPVTTHSI